MPMDVQNVRLRFLAKYGNCKEDDIPIIVLTFLEEYQNCDWVDIPVMISDYLEREVCNCPNVVVNDETDDDEEENEVTYYHHEVSHFVLQDSNLLEHKIVENSDLEDDENIEYVDDYSNDYVPRSFKFVYEDSDDEEDEYYAYDNSPQTTSQAVLQESKSFEHEPMENSAESECSDSDFVESMEEEVLESCVMPDLEAENSAATTFDLELQEMLEIDDEKLEKLVQSGFGDDPILDSEFDKLYQANEEQAQAEIFGVNDSKIMESKSGLASNCFPCNDECMLLIEPKPPNEFLEELVFSGGMVKSNIGHGQMNELLKLDRLASLNRSIDCVHLNYFEEPPDPFVLDLQKLSLEKDVDKPKFDKDQGNCVKSKLSRTFVSIESLVNNSLLDNHGDMKVPGDMFLFMKIGECTLEKCTFIWIINILNEGIWVVGILVWEKLHLIGKTKESVLPNEYDWKGTQVLIDDPP